MNKKIAIRAPAGNLSSLIEAVDVGADGVYIGFQSPTNLRNIPGLNFSYEDAEKGIKYAHHKGKKVYIALNIYPQVDEIELCFKDVDRAYSLGADGVIMTDLAVLEYASSKYPDLCLHLSVQAGSSNSKTINFYQKEFKIKCVILSRTLTIEEVKEIRKRTNVDLEVFVYGSLCANYEGRCQLSSYITGISNNTKGACSPAEYIQFDLNNDKKLKFKLNDIILNEYNHEECCAYPTPCKGRFINTETNKLTYSFQSPVALNLLKSIPQFAEAGVNAFKIEGRQRSEAYVREVTTIFRQALDEYYQNENIYTPRKEWMEPLSLLSEGLK